MFYLIYQHNWPETGIHRNQPKKYRQRRSTSFFVHGTWNRNSSDYTRAILFSGFIYLVASGCSLRLCNAFYLHVWNHRLSSPTRRLARRWVKALGWHLDRWAEARIGGNSCVRQRVLKRAEKPVLNQGATYSNDKFTSSPHSHVKSVQKNTQTRIASTN